MYGLDVEIFGLFINDVTHPKNTLPTEAWWHIGMSSASHREDPGSNPGKGRFFRIKMKDVIYEPSIGIVHEPLIGSGCRAETGTYDL